MTERQTIKGGTKRCLPEIRTDKETRESLLNLEALTPHPSPPNLCSLLFYFLGGRILAVRSRSNLEIERGGQRHARGYIF